MRVEDELLLLRQDHEAWNASHVEAAADLSVMTRCIRCEAVMKFVAVCFSLCVVNVCREH